VLPQKPSPLSDIELIRLYRKSGELKTLGQLFLPYTSLMYGVCLKYLNDREDAKDAVMQVFEKLVHLLREHDVQNFKSWLYVTTRNHCLMQLRSRKGRFREELSADRMENDLLLHPDDESELEENLSKLEKCIAELAEEQQRCVSLFFLQEKCYKDITLLTGFDLNKVKSYIQNGKRNLKICMERNG
jgi:RNA polymerase sigma factor (sigma-70 family)